MSFATIVDVHVVVHKPSVAPSDDEWLAYVGDIGKHVKTLRGVIAVVMPPNDGGPTPRQRKVMTDFWKRQTRHPKVFVLHSSAMLRGVVTALNWILGEQQVELVDPGRIDAIFDDLRLTPDERARVRLGISELRAEFEPSGRKIA
jgi:hypothetical protein